jgi:hypothetical protein
MFERMSQRDKRALIFGVVAVVVILAYIYVGPWFKDWQGIRADLEAKKKQLKVIAPADGDETAQATWEKLALCVPVFEMPRREKDQVPLFRDKFNDQLTKAGIKVKTLQPIGGKSTKLIPGARVKLLKFQCRGTCSLSQVLDLLGGLNSNPHLAGIEELSIKFGQKDRKQIDLVMTVSTFAK